MQSKLVELLERISLESWWLKMVANILMFERATQSEERCEIGMKSENPKTSPEFYQDYVNGRDASRAAALEYLKAANAMQAELVEAERLLRASAPRLLGNLPPSELISIKSSEPGAMARQCRTLLGEVLASPELPITLEDFCQSVPGRITVKAVRNWMSEDRKAKKAVPVPVTKHPQTFNRSDLSEYFIEHRPDFIGIV